MPTPQPLDLADLDPPIWHVDVAGETYGPYTLGQMQSFIREGRITAESRVSQEDAALFRNARDIPSLALLLPIEAAPVVEDDIVADPATGANFVIISRGPDGELRDTRRTLSQALNTFGTFAETLPGVFVLRAASRLADIRAHLERAATPGTQIMIVETRDGRLGWLGMADDIDAHIRSVWKTQPNQERNNP